MSPTRKSFGSDNHAGAHPAVLRALSQANAGDAVAYGDDPLSQRVAARIASLLGAAGGVHFVFNGTAANVLGLSLMLRPHQAVVCPDGAHINVDECGAAERVLGSKLLPVVTANGKLTPELIAPRLDDRGDSHRAQPRVVAISQVTEFGTCYTLAELAALREFCDANDLLLFIDGARLANAAAALDCELAALAATADVLTFGGTKNGAVGAEAVAVMRPGLSADLPYLRKQQMQLASKMRYLAAQFGALLDGGLWLSNARHANQMARRLADGVTGAPGLGLYQPVESNAVFAVLPPDLITALQRDWTFQKWPAGRNVVRWMTAFDTTAGQVDEFAASVRERAGAMAG
ncbi:MAG TPA: aminotransferase class I/II-fold pyridoxal phosphate-dependent enzyme [Streptosporangiaceae bacterium]